MTDRRYFRPGLNFVTAWAAEECGELISALGKTLRWGWDSFNPELPKEERESNRDWVKREMQDVREALDNLDGYLAQDDMTDRIAEAARATRTRDELLEKVSAAIDETLYAYSHGMMSEAMAKESILTIADEWATDDDEILAHMEMLVRDYGAADDNSLTAGAKVLKRRVLVACAPLMNLTAVLEALREPSEGMVDSGDAVAAYGGVIEVWSAMIDAAIAEVRKSDEHI